MSHPKFTAGIQTPQNTIRKPEDLKTLNWYYMQVFGKLKSPESGHSKSYYTICFAPNKETAAAIVHEWLTTLGEDPATCDINWYLKNYKLDAKAMVANNNYIS
jgi:hypothetical protein